MYLFINIIWGCISLYDGKEDRHKRIDPKEATSYFTTSGKSFSK